MQLASVSSEMVVSVSPLSSSSLKFILFNIFAVEAIDVPYPNDADPWIIPAPKP
jgi:hypothetical protein